MAWKPDKILTIILVLCALDMTMVWLPLVRGLMDGSSYEWGYLGLLSGSGTKGDYLILVLIALFGITVQYLGWRGARLPFHLLLFMWNLPALFMAIGILTNPGDYTFHGDTLGVSIPLGVPVAILYGGSFVLVMYWIIKDLLKRKETINPRWCKTNRRLFVLVIALVPVQFLLLRFGEPHGTTDQIGVVLTIMQWFMLVAALYPWSERRVNTPI